MTSGFVPKLATFLPTLDSHDPAGARSIGTLRRFRQSTGTQGGFMKMRIQLVIEDEAGQTTTAEIAGIERRQSDAMSTRCAPDLVPASANSSVTSIRMRLSLRYRGL
jgi:hypothetical protein